MAQRVQIVLTDDLENGVEADETVTFGLDGITYEIDLAADNAAALRESLARYVAAGRRIAGSRPKAGRRRQSAGTNAGDIRAWARSRGMTVSDRGRVSAEVRAAYEAAHN